MKQILTSLLLAAGLVGATQAAPVQWTVGSGGNDHWYEYVAAPATWDMAQLSASWSSFMGMRGYLVTLQSATENTHVSAVVAGGAPAWVGASDRAVEGTWRWMDGPETGVALSYFNWLAGEPNNYGTGEHYLQTNYTATGKWADYGGPNNIYGSMGYVVEYSSNYVPEPGSLALLLPALLAAGALRRRRA